VVLSSLINGSDQRVFSSGFCRVYKKRRDDDSVSSFLYFFLGRRTGDDILFARAWPGSSLSLPHTQFVRCAVAGANLL